MKRAELGSTAFIFESFPQGDRRRTTADGCSTLCPGGIGLIGIQVDRGDVALRRFGLRSIEVRADLLHDIGTGRFTERDLIERLRFRGDEPFGNIEPRLQPLDQLLGPAEDTVVGRGAANAGDEAGSMTSGAAARIRNMAVSPFQMPEAEPSASSLRWWELNTRQMPLEGCGRDAVPLLP